MITIKLSKSDVPLGAVLVCKITNTPFDWGDKTFLPLSSAISLTASNSISRHVARLHPSSDLYPSNILHRTEVDHWLTLCSGPLGTKNISSVLSQLNGALAPSSFLTSGKLTIADLEAFVALYKSQEWHDLQANKTPPPHVFRWFNHIKTTVDPILSSLPPEVLSTLCVSRDDRESSVKREEGGKFVELPGAKMGEVVVRFPPEASGYLHIGHAKAALLNQYYQKAFKGKLIMRFDDTNPDKEKADFEKVILEDLKLLDVQPDIFSFTSDYFEKMLQLCEYLLKNCKAYVDNTDGETMKKEREEKKESKNRNNSFETNIKMWEEMKKGSELGQKGCVRAKIDMNSPNGCLRDPTIYRCKNEAHPRTGTKFKVYPTYDFACPIVDSIEGVTHALRTTEYHDRDDQFFWFIKELNLRPLHIYEYSRLNMNNTVLSKRKLTWFVNEGLVDGWDDPRFPTVRGIVRRGMTIEGLKDFIISQGSSRSVVNMEWDKIWAFNKKVIDREAPRYTGLQGSLVPVIVKGVDEESKEAQKHPKDPSKGMKTIWVGSKVFIEAVDAAELKEGENATFINWGNLKITKIHHMDGKVERVEAEPNLSNTDFKKTLKLTWLLETSKAPWTPIICSYFDHIITKSVLSKDEDFKQFVNTCTRRDVQIVGDDDLKKLNVGDIIQLQRKGFFRVDVAYKAFSGASCKESPLVLFYIPDGHTKELTVISSKKSESVKDTKSLKEKEVVKSSHKIDKPLVSDNEGFQIHLNIKKQGDKIRKLKSEKVDKAVIISEVEILKSLKSDFKSVIGKDWTPDFDVSSFKKDPPQLVPESAPVNALDLHNKIKEQGNKVRDLKTEKADKSAVKEQVDILLSLKNEFKTVTNVEWKPDINVESVLNVKKQTSNESLTVQVTGESLLNKIKDQGDKIRSLKTSIAEKNVIKAEVDVLLNMKKEFQAVTGVEWKQNIDLSKLDLKPVLEVCSKSNEASKVSNISALDIDSNIKAQGDKVRKLKGEKADKETIKTEVNVLLRLKADFKNITGKDWTPDIDLSNFSSVSPKTVVPTQNLSALEVHDKIKEQGDKVRNMKAQKASKDLITVEVNTLLSLKKDFKNITGKDWTPDIDLSNFSSVSPKTVVPTQNLSALEVHDKIKEQGDKVRNMKAQKASKDLITVEVNTLLSLKKDFKNITNIDWKPDVDPLSLTNSKPVKESSPAPKQAKMEKKQKNESKVEESSGKKQTRLGLEAKKKENLSDWYSQAITKSEMIEYYNVSGCYILRPWSYAIWELIKDFFDKEIKALGIENGYFPIFVSKDALEKEKTHIADFSPEVAWVTRSGSSEMAEPVAIRPTSETVMYPAFSKWIQSHRDLPIRINQWNNVVRWEFKQPTPFLRTREFLWQEGHTAFATKEEAHDEVYKILELYAQIYEDLLAIPVVRGHKTKKEQFAGGDFTTTTEAFISASGRAIQGATSHHLGQNFSKMFEIVFEDPKTQEKKYVYQNSWGITTRTIGVMVMVHGDDKGLVLPPMIAPIQVVIMPVGITSSTTSDVKESLVKYCSSVETELKDKGIRTRCDFKDNVTPAWKFNHWELKGVPIRIEVGPRELSENKVFAVRRDSAEKQSLDRMFIERRVYNLLESIQKDMFERAQHDLTSHKKIVSTWSEFVQTLNQGNIMLAPFCGVEECEDTIKNDSARDEPSDAGAPSMGAKGLCIPFDQPGKVDGLKCINPKCSHNPKFYTLFGRSY